MENNEITKITKEELKAKYQFDNVYEPLTFSHYLVNKNGKYGLYSFSGVECVPCEMDTIYEPWNGVYCLKQGDKYGILDQCWNYIAPRFDDTEIDNNEMLNVLYEGEWGYLTVEGKFIAFEDYNEDEDEGLISVAPW